KAESCWETLLSTNESGFIQLTDDSAMWNECSKYANALSRRYKQLGVVGVGGSSLGPKAIYQALGSQNGNAIHFFDNVDGVSFWQQMKLANEQGSMHWLLTSKSGGTIE